MKNTHAGRLGQSRLSVCVCACESLQSDSGESCVKQQKN